MVEEAASELLISYVPGPTKASQEVLFLIVLDFFLHALHNPRYCTKQYQIQRNFYHCQNLYRGFWAAGLYYSGCKNEKTQIQHGPLSATHTPGYGSVL